MWSARIYPVIAKLIFALTFSPSLPSPFPKIRVRHEEISEDIFICFPLPLSPPLPPFSLLKKNRKTAELSFFQGFWKDNGKEEDRLCGLSFLV